MAKIFITYSDDAFLISKLRLRNQAKKSGLFDKVITYSPKDLPDYIKNSPLMYYKKGGGYWIWKPFVILDALSKAKDGDTIFYADAGCRLNPNSDEWLKFDEILKSHNAILFRYRSDEHYYWDMYKHNSVKLLHWIKPSAVEFFKSYCGSESFCNVNKIVAGVIIVKKTSGIKVFEEWMRLFLFYPKLAVDPMGDELTNLPETFNEHRHDQTIISVLAHHYEIEDNLALIDETLESQRQSAAIVAERYKVGKLSFWLDIKTRLYYLFHYYF